MEVGCHSRANSQSIQKAVVNTFLSDCITSVKLHREAEKRYHFSFMNKSLICNVIRQNLVFLLLMNIVKDVTYLISGIYVYSNLHTFLYKKV